VPSQSPAYVRFRRALDHGNATEALWAAGEVEFVGLAEALELTLLLAEGDSGRTDWQPQRWPSSSADGEASSDVPRLLSPGARSG
jgi:hypothetical protein